MIKITNDVARIRQKGFTVVELITVIFVIAILFTVTAVAYLNVQDRARNAVSVSMVNQWEKILKLYKAEKGHYPIGNLDYVCLGNSYPAVSPYELNQCAKMPTWGVSTDPAMLADIKNVTSVSVPESNLSTAVFVNMGGESEYYRGILYLHRNNGFGITYMVKGDGSSCDIGDGFFESGDTVACRRVLEGDPYNGL